MIESHGNESVEAGDSISAELPYDDTTVQLNAPVQEFTFPSDRVQALEWMNQEAIQTFSPIRNRFTSDARVYLTGCNLLEGGPSNAALKLEAIRFVLGLKGGSLYANSTLGLDLAILFNQPFWKQPALSGKKFVAIAQLTSLATLTTLGVLLADLRVEVFPFIIALAAFSIRNAFNNKGYFSTPEAAASAISAKKFQREIFFNPSCDTSLWKSGGQEQLPSPFYNF
jgi:hypothetical protein